MSTFRDYRKESRSIWGAGAFLRIADAMELMAKDHAQLVGEKEQYKRWYEEEKGTNARLLRQVNAYKGIVKKFKNKAK